jgi:fatty-acyl-CoA synthase/2,3-dihydroxybenzoate-AMP ligase
MRGYLDRDDLTSQVIAQGWFCTGDLGWVDDRGWLHLRGREREEINKGGIKIHPEDVDAVVEQFTATLDTCCFGYEDPLLGENVGIAVVVNGPSLGTARELREWARQRLASHQIPVRWYVVDAIPRTSRGKIDRARMAEQCAGLTPVSFSDVT